MLIVEGEVHAGGDGDAVVGLEDCLEPGFRQLSVADEDAEPAGGEVGARILRYVVDDAGDAEGVVRAAPALALDGQTRGDRPIDLGELVSFLVAVVEGPARAGAARRE